MKLLIDFLLVAGIVVNAIILIKLVKTQKRDIHLNFLMTLFVLFFFFLVSGYGIFHQVKFLQKLALPFQGSYFLIGPLIYLYVKSLKKDSGIKIEGHWKHFIPYFLYLALITIPIFISAYKKKYIFRYLEVLNEYYFINDIAELLFIVVYASLSLRLFHRFSQQIKNYYSQLDYKNIKWIRLLTIGMLITSAINVVVTLIESTSGGSDLLDLTLVVSFVGFVFFLGYYGLQQDQIALYETKENTEKPLARSYIDEDEKLELHRLLSSKFIASKPYLDEDLTLRKLADFLSTTDKKLSFYLNNHLDTNFYTFINQHRVKEFENRLNSDSNSNLSLLGIAYECGFKSKSSFNRIFKNETGMSPSAYKKSLGK